MKTIWIICINAILLFAIVALVFPVSADDTGPDVSNINRDPKWPLYGDGVNITATITDPDTVTSAQIVYCDDVLCYAPVVMQKIPLTDTWFGIIQFKQGVWFNETWIGYEIQTYDSAGNHTFTDKEYYIYVSKINLTAQVDKNSIILGETVNLTGSAIYNGNETAFVEYSEVIIAITGPDSQLEYKYMQTDSQGNFSLEIPFDLPGTYGINVTLTNRTMSAYFEDSVFVLGITHLSEKVQMTTCYPGQSFWVNGTARYNNGNPVVDSAIKLKINESLIWTSTTDSNGNYSILITPPSTLGTYVINASVTKGTLSCFNETSITVIEQPLPDLSVSAEDITLTSSYTPFIEGEEINITIKIENLGLAHCSDVKLKIFNGNPNAGILISQSNFTSIFCGSHSTFSLLWTPLNGTYDVWVVVDPDNNISESFEDNNNISISIFVDNDFDGDKQGDSVDVDDDGDGINDDVDAFPQNPAEWLDTDLDRIGNNADTDDDQDGLLDTQELARGTNPLKADTDGDGVNDRDDYKPLNPRISEKPDEPDELPWLLILFVIVIVVVVIIFAVVFPRRNKK